MGWSVYDKIVQIDEDKYCTYKLLKNGIDYLDIRVKYYPDMFYLSINIIVEAGYAIADDEEGNHLTVLMYKPSEYCFFI